MTGASPTVSAIGNISDPRVAAQRARRSGSFLRGMRTRWPLTVGVTVVLLLLFSAIAAPLLAPAGIPVVSGLTISLDMRIVELRFTQSVTKREALDVSLRLEHVPRSSLAAVIGEVADLSLAAATSAVPTGLAAHPIARALGPPI